jgi:hypothetical protein
MESFSHLLEESGISTNHTWQIESALKQIHTILRTITEADCNAFLSRPLESWIDEMCTRSGFAPIEWKDFKVQMFLAMEKEFKKGKENENSDSV